MLFKLLGILDLIAVISILFAGFLPNRFLITIALLLIVKGTFFFITGNIMSILDGIAGVYLILLAFNVSVFIISLILAIYLGQKAIMSVFF